MFRTIQRGMDRSKLSGAQRTDKTKRPRYLYLYLVSIILASTTQFESICMQMIDVNRGHAPGREFRMTNSSVIYIIIIDVRTLYAVV